MSSRPSRTLYVGNLPGDIKEWEIEDLFYKYGPIVDIDLKVPPRPPGYCFIEFEDARDAEDAIRGRDGYNFDGHRIRVELAHGGRRTASSVRSSNYNNGGGGRGGGVSRRTDYRVLVSGLPSSASWQDLKDHMRQAGDVCYAEVFRDSNGTCGTVDYTNLDDMKYAVRKLDDSEFKNAFSRSYIQVREYGPKKSISESHSCSRSHSNPRNHSCSHSNNRSRSRSRSVGRSNRKVVRQSPSRSRSRSPSRSRPRSPSISRKVIRRSPSCSISRSPLRSRPHSPSISGKVARWSSSRLRSRSPLRSRPHSPSISRSMSRSLSSRHLHAAPKNPSRSASRSRSPSRS